MRSGDSHCRDGSGTLNVLRRSGCRIKRLCFGLVSLLVLTTSVNAATPQGARDSIVSDDLKRHVGFLASDTLEGRAAGSEGGRAAAAYLAQELRKIGLQPGADDGDFLQPFKGSNQNLLAVLPGSDPALKDEVIIVSGHFDHVGLGNRGNSFGPFGQIHNGADDNASGTAAVLEVAEAMAALDDAPRRTVLFAFWDAEESGMNGSKYWLKNPTFPLENVRLMTNCDMVGRLRNDTLVVYGIRTAPGLRQQLAQANLLSQLNVNFDWEQRDDSDHWPFFKRQIPYLLLHTGDHLDYHRPSDDADKVNYEGLQTISRLLFELTQRFANADSLPPFRMQAQEERTWDQQQSEAVPEPSPPRLGMSWNGDRRPGEPFQVTRVTPGSPAALAGLEVGDRIVSFGGTPAAEIGDFGQFVLALPQQTTAKIERENQAQPLTLSITLRGNPVRLGVSWKTDEAEPGVAIVTNVVPGSPASTVGIEPLDRLLPPEGIDASDTNWLSTIATGFDDVPLFCERRGRIVTHTVRLLPSNDSATPTATP